MNIKITGSGSFIPQNKVSNIDFGQHTFLNEDGSVFGYSNDIVIAKAKAQLNREAGAEVPIGSVSLALHYLVCKTNNCCAN